MRTIEEIKADIASWNTVSYLYANEKIDKLNAELREALAFSVPLDRLEDICSAERDGRLVKMPCKVGDMVYFVADGEVRNTTLLAIKANISDPEYAGNPTIIFEGYFQLGIHVFCWMLGERLYLTYAEAEAALKGSNSTPLKSEAEKS